MLVISNWRLSSVQAWLRDLQPISNDISYSREIVKRAYFSNPQQSENAGCKRRFQLNDTIPWCFKKSTYIEDQIFVQQCRKLHLNVGRRSQSSGLIN